MSRRVTGGSEGSAGRYLRSRDFSGGLSVVRLTSVTREVRGFGGRLVGSVVLFFFGSEVRLKLTPRVCQSVSVPSLGPVGRRLV